MRHLICFAAMAAISLTACDKSPAAEGKGNPADTLAAKVAPAAGLSSGDGFAVYEAQNCALCHGPTADGTEHAPALTGIKANWDKDKLSAYLKDPQGYADKDPRLAANREKYAMRMTPFTLSEEDEAALIEFLLSR